MGCKVYQDSALASKILRHFWGFEIPFYKIAFANIFFYTLYIACCNFSKSFTVYCHIVLIFMPLLSCDFSVEAKAWWNVKCCRNVVIEALIFMMKASWYICLLKLYALLKEHFDSDKELDAVVCLGQEMLYV